MGLVKLALASVGWVRVDSQGVDGAEGAWRLGGRERPPEPPKSDCRVSTMSRATGWESMLVHPGRDQRDPCCSIFLRSPCLCTVSHTSITHGPQRLRNDTPFKLGLLEPCRCTAHLVYVHI
ncbi:hypothetical protein F5Y18DRAFT_400492 [Xylariaceae sp. FL1019]|nr:hypothetical protein F5Y18DRAFT_400492 [Xylariaceae sp. FL1019]